MSNLTEICELHALADNSAQAFQLPDGRRIFLVKKQETVFGYINNCPHAGWPLNLTPTGFLDIDREFIQCANHMALFDIRTGKCVSGPCINQQLTPLDLTIDQDKIYVSESIAS